jgi:hypothetical protein
MATEKERPANDVEKTLARIWSELFHVHAVGPRDNFFQLGGHSLLAVQVGPSPQKIVMALLFIRGQCLRLRPSGRWRSGQ